MILNKAVAHDRVCKYSTIRKDLFTLIITIDKSDIINLFYENKSKLFPLIKIGDFKNYFTDEKFGDEISSRREFLKKLKSLAFKSTTSNILENDDMEWDNPEDPKPKKRKRDNKSDVKKAESYGSQKKNPRYEEVKKENRKVYTHTNVSWDMQADRQTPEDDRKEFNNFLDLYKKIDN